VIGALTTNRPAGKRLPGSTLQRIPTQMPLRAVFMQARVPAPPAWTIWW